ncbi:MAG: hypothetical protein OEM67_04670 [Thermoleophilia bacterium]|nr:hypothetical protein [Thermoleophilia bacterium]MDH3725501.1 hypothetical protein [Thermoleophilia bacterium]
MSARGGRDPRVQILVATPNEAETPGHGELAALGEGERPPGAEEFLARTWLDQAQWQRGSRLETLGLSIHAGHPELALANLPTAFVEGGIALMEKLAAYVLAGGRLDDGELLQLDEGLPSLLGFAPADDGDYLRVVCIS